MHTFIGFTILALTSTLEISAEVFVRCNEPGLVALTFDDGPHSSLTVEVLDVLKEFNVSATFFLLGLRNWEWNETRYMETVTRQLNEGHEIGSHTWSHQNLSELTADEIRTELRTQADLLYSILGFNVTVFRPPHGEYNDLVEEIVKEFGYDLVNWNVDTFDWSHPGDTEAGLQGWIDAIEGNEDTSYIGLHHDVQMGSPELARRTIEYVLSKGFKFVTVSDCIKPSSFRFDTKSKSFKKTKLELFD